MKLKCGECRRKFKTDTAYGMHMRSKHPHVAAAKPYRPRSPWRPVFVASFFGCLLAIVAAYLTAPYVGSMQAGVIKAVHQVKW